MGSTRVKWRSNLKQRRAGADEDRGEERVLAARCLITRLVISKQSGIGLTQPGLKGVAIEVALFFFLSVSLEASSLVLSS
jgi:hypothetical protein